MRIDTAAVVPVSEVLPTHRKGVVMELNSDIVELSVPEIRAQCRQCGAQSGKSERVYLIVVLHRGCPQLQVTSGWSLAPSQKALQYLLSSAAGQAHAGWAHLSF